MIHTPHDLSPQSKILFDVDNHQAAYYFSEHFDNYSLEARHLTTPQENAPMLLAIPGSLSDYSSLNALLYHLQNQGIQSLSCSLSTHSLAARHISSSLAQNTHEVLQFAKKTPKIDAIYGSSLGGYLALQVAKALNIQKIILFCPAIYGDEAWQKPYGLDFKNTISQAYSYENSCLWPFLQEYTGELLLVMGEFDGIKTHNGQSQGFFEHQGKQFYSPIPGDVLGKLDDIIAQNPKMQKLTIPHIDHYLTRFCREDESLWLRNRVADFILS